MILTVGHASLVLAKVRAWDRPTKDIGDIVKAGSIRIWIDGAKMPFVVYASSQPIPDEVERVLIDQLGPQIVVVTTPESHPEGA